MKNYHIVKRRASNSEIRYRPALMHPKQDIIIGVLAGESLYDASCHLERLIDSSLKSLLDQRPIEPSSKGEWIIRERMGVTFIDAGDEVIARVNDKANAHLICATVNACAKVNRANPMAVAESISDLYEKLLKVQKWLEMLIRNAEHQLLTCRFATLREALKSDINNYKATLSDVRQATAKAKRS